MPQPNPKDRTISSVERGHLTSVICGQPTSVLTLLELGDERWIIKIPEQWHVPTIILPQLLAPPTDQPWNRQPDTHAYRTV